MHDRRHDQSAAMTTPQEDAAKDRKDQAGERLKAAERIKSAGAGMMLAGGILLAVAITAFILAREPEIPSWVRQTALTLIGMLWIGGLGLCITGHALRMILAQLVDDRAERTVQHEEVLTELREIKRRQTFLIARGGSQDPSPPKAGPRATKPPTEDTLDMVQRVRKEREQEPGKPPPQQQPTLHDEIQDYLRRPQARDDDEDR